VKLDRRLLGAAFALAAVAYGARPGAYDLWNPNEPRRAQAAREMFRGGDALALRLNGLPYYDKPPLWYWLTALVSLPAGDVTPTTARLVSVLSALGLFTLMIGFLRGRTERPETPLTAAAILLTAPMLLIHPYLGRAANMEALLCFLTTASVFSFWAGTWRGSIVAGLLCGLAILAKGPAGLLVPAIGFILGGWAWGGRRCVARALAAVAVGLGVAALWFVPAALREGPAFVEASLQDHIVERVLHPRSHQRDQWYYYLRTLGTHFFPWVLALPFGLWAARHRRQAPLLSASAGVLILTVLAFTLSRSKREIYVLPAFPFAAIVVAGLLEREPRRTVRLLIGATAATALVAGLVAAGAIPLRSEDVPAEALATLLNDVRVPLILGAGALLGPAALALAWARRPVPAAAHALAIAAFLTVASLAVHQRMLPALDRLVSARPLAERMNALARPGERWAQVGLEDMGLVYYADRLMELWEPADVAGRLSGRRPVFGVARRDGFHALHEAAAPGTFESLEPGVIGSKRDLILFRWTPSSR
jgi:4-amino-4-deoxy-L-arabinose transferase-like glycosyltransferase